MRKEKREYSRVEVSWPVTMLAGQKLIVGEIKDISMGGALIHCKEVPSEAKSLELRIEITDLFCVSATVESVRFEMDDSRTDFKAYHLSVRFTGMTVDQRKILHNAIGRETSRQGR